MPSVTAFQGRRLHDADLAVEAEGRDWKVKVYPMKVGCTVFVASSTTSLLREMGIRGQAGRKAIIEVATVAELSSLAIAEAKGCNMGCQVTV